MSHCLRRPLHPRWLPHPGTVSAHSDQLTTAATAHSRVAVPITIAGVIDRQMTGVIDRQMTGAGAQHQVER